MDNDGKLIAEFNQKVQKILWADEPKKNLTLYHYTSVYSFKKILTSKELHFTHYEDLNDSSEIKYGQEVISKIIEQSTMKKGMFTNLLHSQLPKNFEAIRQSFKPYIFSFCKNTNYYPAWRFYGDEGKGVAIGFKADSIKAKKISACKNHVNYSDTPCIKNNIEAAFSLYLEYNEKIKTPILEMNFLGTLFIYALFIKHYAYKTEEEYRYVIPISEEQEMTFENEVFITDDFFIRRAKLATFTPDDIEKIYFGPCMSEEKIAQIKAWL